MGEIGRQYVTSKGLLITALVLICVIGGLGVIFPPHIYPLAVVFGAMAVFFMMYSPMSALLIYLIFFLAWPQEWAPYFSYLPGFTERIIGFMAIGSMALSFMFRQRSTFHLGLPGYGILVFFAAMVLTMISSYYMTATKDALVDLLRLIVVFILVVNIVETPKQLRWVAHLYFFLIIVMAAMSINNYYHGGYQYRMGIMRAIGLGGSYADPNAHAATLTYAAPLIFYFMKDAANRWQRLLLAGGSVIILANIVLTGSRTAMVGVLFLAAVVIARSKRKFAYTAVAVVGLMIAVMLMPDQYVGRFESTTDLSSETSSAESARGRIEGLEHGFKLFLMHPITGVGAGCYLIARGTEFGVWFQSHNMLGELIAEGGIVGFSAFCFFTYALLITIRRCRKRLKRLEKTDDNRFMSSMVEGILVSLWLLFLFGLAGHNLYRYNWFFFAAFVVVIDRELDRQEAAAEKQVEPAPSDNDLHPQVE
ncbi:MAG TPA: O-antigen ligase family protein [candidate division Zixibacteria bacterium]|nr:O-antigen ligase family protein [candidate division Zixibacteria bacterium]